MITIRTITTLHTNTKIILRNRIIPDNTIMDRDISSTSIRNTIIRTTITIRSTSRVVESPTEMDMLPGPRMHTEAREIFTIIGPVPTIQ